MAPRFLLPALLIVLLICPTSIRANDSAAEVAAGGILLRHEPRISMNRERLTISREKVTVEYEFLNESNADITTEVAFPIPPYEAETDEGYPPKWFDDFHVWVNDEPVPFEIATQATLKDTDYSLLLRSLGIDLPTFAHFDGGTDRSDLQRLPPDQKSRLVKLGLMDDLGIPLWTLSKTYHWEQSFPAHNTVHVRHEYKPVIGSRGFKAEEIAGKLENACLDPNLPAKLSSTIAKGLASGRRVKGDDYIYVDWVKYILTTANSWKTPIQDFELIIDRSGSKDAGHNLVSLCWDGPVRRLDANRFSAKKFNFVPARELTVYFIQDF